MELFTAIEKCFPEMEKHFLSLWPQEPDFFISLEMARSVECEMHAFLLENYLQPGMELRQLFCNAGVVDTFQMKSFMLVWLQMSMNERKVWFSRISTFPVRL